MKKILIGAALLLFSTFFVSADVSIDASSNLTFNEYGLGVSFYELMLDKVGISVGASVNVEAPVNYEIDLGGNIELVDNLYLTAGTSWGVDKKKGQDISLGLRYFFLDKVGISVSTELPFMKENFDIGVSYKL